ncbi:MAG: hypothetical protein AAF709_22865 [Pseudomonadota bacterium]
MSDSSQMKIRLSDDLRRRIKAYGDRHNLSMNSLISHALEHHFPVQWPFDERVGYLVEQLKTLAEMPSSDALDRFSTELHKTFLGILTGRTIVQEHLRNELVFAVREYIARIDETEAENAEEEYLEKLRDYAERYTLEERQALRVVNFPEKYPVAPPADLIIPAYEEMSEAEQAL